MSLLKGTVSGDGQTPTDLLPPVVHISVAQQSLPRQPLHTRRYSGDVRIVGKDHLTPRRERLPLRHEVVLDQAEGAPGHQVGADVQVAGVAGAERQRVLREAVLGDVLVGGGEDGLLARVEDACGRRVVVGMVAPQGCWLGSAEQC